MGVQLGVVAPMFGEVGESSSSIAAVEAHPPPVDVDQAGARCSGTLEHGFVDGRVVDDHGPIDDRRGAEPAAASGIPRCGDTFRGRRSAGEAFGCEQLDVDGGQGIDRLERGRSNVEIDTRSRIGEPRREPRSEEVDVDACRGEALGKHREEPLVAGEVQRCRKPAGNVCSGAPSTAVVGVDELQRQRPVTERVIGKGQPQAGAHDRFALAAADGLIEDRRQIIERLAEVGVGTELADRRAQCPSDGSGGPGRHAAGIGDRCVPAGPGQEQPGGLIDEGLDDDGRQFFGSEPRTGHGDHRRLACGQFGHGTGEVDTKWSPTSHPPPEARIGELWQNAPRRDEADRHRVCGAEPTDRCADLCAQRIELAERRQRGNSEALAHHLLLAAG